MFKLTLIILTIAFANAVHFRTHKQPMAGTAGEGSGSEGSTGTDTTDGYGGTDATDGYTGTDTTDGYTGTDGYGSPCEAVCDPSCEECQPCQYDGPCPDWCEDECFDCAVCHIATDPEYCGYECGENGDDQDCADCFDSWLGGVGEESGSDPCEAVCDPSCEECQSCLYDGPCPDWCEDECLDCGVCHIAMDAEYCGYECGENGSDSECDECFDSWLGGVGEDERKMYKLDKDGGDPCDDVCDGCSDCFVCMDETQDCPAWCEDYCMDCGFCVVVTEPEFCGMECADSQEACGDCLDSLVGSKSFLKHQKDGPCDDVCDGCKPCKSCFDVDGDCPDWCEEDCSVCAVCHVATDPELCGHECASSDEECEQCFEDLFDDDKKMYKLSQEQK